MLIQNGNSQIDIQTANGNANITINGNSNVAVFSEGALTMKGNVLPSANITYDLGSPTQMWRTLYVSGNTIVMGASNLTISGNTLSVGTDPVVTVSPTGTSNTTGNMNVIGNITGSNVTTAGLILATGNITGGNLLTGGLISATGNITGGNLRTGGLISATGNITGGNINTGNITIASDLISSLGDTITIDPYNVGNTGHVIINGNLQVNGTTTTINSNVVSTNDLTVNYANNAINSLSLGQ